MSGIGDLSGRGSGGQIATKAFVMRHVVFTVYMPGHWVVVELYAKKIEIKGYIDDTTSEMFMPLKPESMRSLKTAVRHLR